MFAIWCLRLCVEIEIHLEIGEKNTIYLFYKVSRFNVII